MERLRLAAWILAFLMCAGVLLPLLVLSLVKPQTEVEKTVKINGTLPLDVYFLIDSSDSMSMDNWKLALNFAGDMARALQAELPHMRAAMGQFANTAELLHPLSANLSAFRSPVGERARGRTNVSNGLCGNDLPSPLLSCPGGAYGELLNAPPQGPDAGGLDCGMDTQRLIILVTDGVPYMPELAVQAVRYVKNHSSMVLMGILVTSEPRADWRQFDTEELYAMSSCCLSSNTDLRKTGKWNTERVSCTAEVNLSCPSLVTETSFEALAKSVDHLVLGLRQEMACTAVTTEKLFQTDWRALWFLVLVAPVLVYLCWQNILLCLSKSQYFVNEVRASLASRPAEVELSFASEQLAAVGEAERAMAGLPNFDGAWTHHDNPGEHVYEISGVELKLDGALQSPLALGKDGFKATLGGSELSGSMVEGEIHLSNGTRLIPLTEAHRASRATRTSQASESGYTGRKWEPVRTAYIVGGQRMDVDYGHHGGSLPPAAQLGARRGMDSEDPEPDGYAPAMFRRVPSLGARAVSAKRMVKQLSNVRLQGLPDEEVAPMLRRVNFSIFVPLACTLLLLPLVVWQSGLLGVLGLVHSDREH